MIIPIVTVTLSEKYKPVSLKYGDFIEDHVGLFTHMMAHVSCIRSGN